MKKIKRIFHVLLIVSLLFSLAACGPKNNNTTTSTSSNTGSSIVTDSDDGSGAANDSEGTVSGGDSSGQSSSKSGTDGSSTASGGGKSSSQAPVTSANPPAVSTKYDLGGKTITIGMTVYDSRTESSSVLGKYKIKQREGIEKAFNCKIKVEQIDWSTYQTKVAAGTSPYDIASMSGPGFYAIFMKNKYISPLNDYINVKQPQIDVDFMNQFSLYNGQYYAIFPKATGYDSYKDTLAMWFNKRLVKQAGYDPDSLYELVKSGAWNWAKFEEIAIKVDKLSSSIYGACGGYTDDSLWIALALSNDSDIVKKSGNSYTFNNADQKFKNAVSFWQKLQVNDNVVYNKMDLSHDTMFVNGKAGFIAKYINRVEVSQYINMGDDYGILPLPKGTDAKDYYANLSWKDGYVILNSRLKGDDKNHTFAKAVCAITAELCKSPIPASEAKKVQNVMLESYVRDRGSLETFSLYAKNQRYSQYYNGLSPVLEALLFKSGDKLAPVIAGSANAQTVFDANASAINTELKNTWTFN